MGTRRPVTRAATTFAKGQPRLGPQAELPGLWMGTGFNMISRPDFHNKQPFFLEINGTQETLEFTKIRGQIPNRGSKQDDAFLNGVHYFQELSDCQTHGALHIEPSLWIFVPATQVPNVTQATVVRHATIPHGDSLLAQSNLLLAVDGGPTIDPVGTIPFTDPTIPPLNASPKNPVTNADYLKQFTEGKLSACCLPAGLNLNDVVKDPTAVLRAAIQGQNITHTQVIGITTAAPAGSAGILNVPFVVANANALQMDAIFWIETVQPTDGDPFLQLQYIQRVILDFPPTPSGASIHWPHVSAATLVKQWVRVQE